METRRLTKQKGGETPSNFVFPSSSTVTKRTRKTLRKDGSRKGGCSCVSATEYYTAISASRVLRSACLPYAGGTLQLIWPVGCSAQPSDVTGASRPDVSRKASSLSSEEKRRTGQSRVPKRQTYKKRVDRRSVSLSKEPAWMSPQSFSQAAHHSHTPRDEDQFNSSTSERRSSLSRRRAAAAGSSNISSSTDIRLRELKPANKSTTLFSADDGHTKSSYTSAEEDSDGDMAIGRPSMQRPGESRSKVPLLKGDSRGRSASVGPASMEEGRPSLSRARPSFRSKSPDFGAKNATRKKYIIAAFALFISLISFTVQTQTAVYIQQELGWNKPYCML